MVLGMLTALALNQPWRPGRGVFRTIYFVPVMTSVVASAFVWRWLFEPTFGVVNWILRQIGIVDPPGWLASTTWALPALMTAGIWKQVGYAMVLFLAGRQTIPRELREVAEIDGANPWQIFWHVTLPLLNPTVVFVAVILVINAFRVFSIPYVMTSGGFTYLTPGGPLNSTRVFVQRLESGRGHPCQGQEHHHGSGQARQYRQGAANPSSGQGHSSPPHFSIRTAAAGCEAEPG